MLWIGFTSQHKLIPYLTSSSIDGKEYKKILRKCLIPAIRGLEYEDDIIFPQDNAPAHKSELIELFLEQNDIESLNWRPCSPDLNPAENAFSAISRIVYAKNRHYKSCQELSEAIKNAWEHLAQDFLDSIVKSVPTRLLDVVENRRSYTKY